MYKREVSPHILVAEDEPKIAALLVDYLQAAGMQQRRSALAMRC